MGDLIAVAGFLTVIGLIGIVMSGKAIYEYGERMRMMAEQFTYGYESITNTYPNGRLTTADDQELKNLAESIWKIQSIAVDNKIVQVADERGELYDLLAQAASLAETIRARA